MEKSGKKTASFDVRGIVEGFYGPQWGWKERAEMLAFAAECGYNAYIYAPKDDPYHREKWRDPYPPPARRKFRELLKTAGEGGVEFCWALSPGLSVGYGSPKDFRALTEKFSRMIGDGFASFALFLDDIPDSLQRATDKKKYASLAEAQADLNNRLLGALKAECPAVRLIFCPTLYHGVQESDYWKTLGAELSQEIGVFWTGEQIVSPGIRREQAEDVGRQLRRPPIIWDNYPVNDYYRQRLNLGPLRGRDADLCKAAAGFFANPMNEARLSRIPLRTIADYLKDPAGYDPERSFKKAVKKEGGADAALLEKIAECFLPGFFNGEPPSPFDEKLRRENERIKKEGKPGKALEKDIHLLNNAEALLKNSSLDVGYRKELRHYLKKMRMLASMLEDARRLPPEKIQGRLKECSADPWVVHGRLIERHVKERLKIGNNA